MAFFISCKKHQSKVNLYAVKMLHDIGMVHGAEQDPILGNKNARIEGITKLNAQLQIQERKQPKNSGIINEARNKNEFSMYFSSQISGFHQPEKFTSIWALFQDNKES